MLTQHTGKLCSAATKQQIANRLILLELYLTFVTTFCYITIVADIGRGPVKPIAPNKSLIGPVFVVAQAVFVVDASCLVKRSFQLRGREQEQRWRR